MESIRPPAIANVNRIRHTIRTKLKPGEIVRLGGMTDCFQPLEKINRITLQTIQALNEMGVGYLIVTKSGLVAEEEYIEAMDKNLAHIQVSITHTNDEMCRKVEPGAPLPKIRIAAVEKLQKEGFDVQVRLSPYVPEFVDTDIINAIKCDKILVEFLRVNTRIKKWLGEVGNIDLSPYTLTHSGYKHLPLEKKKELLNKINGFKEISVCEDVPEHQLYWDAMMNHNPADCCNLRNVFSMGDRNDAIRKLDESQQMSLF